VYFDMSNIKSDLHDMAGFSRSVEQAGFDGLWQGEVTGDPFLPLALASEHTQALTIGTSIALAFTRSPTLLAHIAYELARQSEGRFVLGLGSQVRAHVERRFGMAWSQPVERMRATIEGIQAVWRAWQTGEPLKYRSPFFRLDFMPPFFCPAPHEYGSIPVYLAAVNQRMLTLAGEIAEGCLIHPLHTVAYLDEVAIPSLKEGRQHSTEPDRRVIKSSTIFVVPTDDDDYARRAEQDARQQIAFYLSTPAYRIVTDLHGWSEIQSQLSRLARSGKWSEMGNAVPDSVMNEVVVRGTWAQLPGMITQKYADRLDRVSYYLPFVADEQQEGWRASVAGFKASRR
jgi:probable F420-dependent oxidoreductase